MIRKLLLLGALILAAACANDTVPMQGGALQHSGRAATNETLVAYDNDAGDIEEWNVTASGGTTPWVAATPSFTSNVVAMAGAGDVGSGEEVLLAGAAPQSQTFLYDLSTGSDVDNTMPEPWGAPLDVVSIIGQSASTLYADGSYQTMPFDRNQGIHKTACTGILSTANAITADTEGDVFIQGTGPGGFEGVVEVSQATQNCSALSLKPQKGTAAGITIDPATNDLIVGDNPRSCAGNMDGRLIVYPPPYRASTGTIHKLSGVGCAGLFRIDSGTTGTTYIFMLDSDGGTPQIDQLECCDMTLEGTYSGGDPSATTTLPNRLPNG